MYLSNPDAMYDAHRAGHKTYATGVCVSSGRKLVSISITVINVVLILVHACVLLYVYNNCGVTAMATRWSC